MADVFSKEKRSKIMAVIGSKDTKPELIVRRLLHALGFRYRLHAKGIPGRPDIFFPGRRAAVFVHGCFWHGHEGCSRARLPTTNEKFWKEKIGKNVLRDRSNQRFLKALKIRSITVWQCEIRDLMRLERRLVRFLRRPAKSGES